MLLLSEVTEEKDLRGRRKTHTLLFEFRKQREPLGLGRAHRPAKQQDSLFDAIEEGQIQASPYTSHEIDEHDSDKVIDGLQDRVSVLKGASKSGKSDVKSYQ